MGLFSRLDTKLPVKRSHDDVLLMHAMMLMASADGVVELPELATVEAFLTTLPEFHDKDFGSLVDQANQVIARYGSKEESVKSLGEIQSEAVRKKCFILAADLALSSGEVVEAEERLLETMQGILGIDDELATKILEVLALKYAQ